MNIESQVCSMELLPCPFCGNSPIIISYHFDDKTKQKIKCHSCFYSMEYTDFTNKFNHEKADESLLSRWNKRAFPADTYRLKENDESDEIEILYTWSNHGSDN